MYKTSGYLTNSLYRFAPTINDRLSRMAHFTVSDQKPTVLSTKCWIYKPTKPVDGVWE